MTKHWKTLAAVVAVVITGLVLWNMYDWWQRRQGKANAELEARYTAQVDSTASWKARWRKDSLDVYIYKLAMKEVATQRDAALDSADWYKARYTTLRAKRPPAPPYSDSTNPGWRTRALALEVEVGTLTAENTQLREVVKADSARARLMLGRLHTDSLLLVSANQNIIRLDRLVEDYRKKGNCRVLGLIRCPTRVQSYVAGAVTVVGVLVAPEVAQRLRGRN